MSFRPYFLLWTVLFLCQFLQNNTLSGRSLELGKASWKVDSKTFHLNGVIDERKIPGPVGKITGSKTADLTIAPDLATGIANYLDGCIESDTTTTVGIDFVIDRFKITDAISGQKHNVSMDFNFKLVRDIDGERITLYESSIRPSLTGMGTDAPVGFYEQPVKDAIKKFLEAFDQWSKKNRKNPYFMNHVVVSFRDDHKWNDRSVGDSILWSEAYRLTWADFKGKDKTNSPFSAQSNCVYTLGSVPEFSTDTFFITETIQPVFTRGASWVHEDAYQDTLLMHEQLHFDICELYARRFRSELSKMRLGVITFDKQINELFGRTVKEYSNRQSLYDEETEHGTITNQQLYWMKSIREELDDLSDFRTGKP